MMTSDVIVALLLALSFTYSGFALTPRESESREIFSLDGLWYFLVEPITNPHIGVHKKWFLKRFGLMPEAQMMPVPSSYNDVTQDAALRDHVGVVWYQKCVYLPQRFTDLSRRVIIHFGSVHYNTTVWVNDNIVVRHEGGHLPFQANIGSQLLASDGEETCITVAVNNTLTPRTLPQGRLIRTNDTTMYPPGYVKQMFEFDFFNYAGIQRSVTIYTTPHSYLHDVTLTTGLETSEQNELLGIINYKVEFKGPAIRQGDYYFTLVVYDENDTEVTRVSLSRELKGDIVINTPRLWWPFLSRDQKRFAHLYTLEIQLVPNNNVQAVDIYRINFGIRSLNWNHENIFINDIPFYFRGFGRHEDSNIRGRGLDMVLVWHDGYLLQWLGANSYRTSHYPYSEESLDVADRLGLVVIAATPSVGLKGFSNQMLRRHLASARELISRDKNRPSIIMWSLANEPLSQLPAADPYFKALSEGVANLDPTRPITIVTSQQWSNDVAIQHADVVCVNRYAGWYGDGGHLDLVALQTEAEVNRWHEKFARPVIISEYGAGALAGFHSQPSSMWTEDYQSDIFHQHFKAFDKLHLKGFFIGEIIWNFADFATPQEVIRPTGCMKGVMTRNRLPKQGAHVVRQRYWTLAHRHCMLAAALRNITSLTSVINNSQEFTFNCDIALDKKLQI